jgi:hypothetical protein
MDTQDFRRCYTCGCIMPQRAGGQCPSCNPHPDPEPCPESMDEDYDWSSKEIDHRGPDPEDYEESGEPILGSYVICRGREGYTPPLQDHADASVRLDIEPECYDPSLDPEDECPCGDPDCTAMYDLPENEADHHPTEPCESLNEKTHAPCGAVDNAVIALWR